MEQNKIYNSYNQITKEFDVMGVSIQEVITNKQLKDKQCLVLFDKKKGPGVTPDPKITLKDVYKILMQVVQKVDAIEKIQQQEHELLLKVIRLNKLKTE